RSRRKHGVAERVKFDEETSKRRAKQSTARAQQRIHDERLHHGLCVRCKKERDASRRDRKLCAACAAENEKRTSEHYQMRVATGICTRCGHKRDSGGTLIFCSDCAAHIRERSRLIR